MSFRECRELPCRQRADFLGQPLLFRFPEAHQLPELATGQLTRSKAATLAIRSRLLRASARWTFSRRTTLILAQHSPRPGHCVFRPSQNAKPTR